MFAGILKACADHVVKDLGKQVYGYITRIKVSSLFIYSKYYCSYGFKYGTIKNATKVFKGMPLSDLVSWTFLIVRNAQNG